MESFLAWMIRFSGLDLDELVGEFALDHGLDSGETSALRQELDELVERQGE